MNDTYDYTLQSGKFEGERLSQLTAEDLREYWRYRPSANDLRAIREYSHRQRPGMDTRPQSAAFAA